MELRHIRYFLAVAEERHFTRAATKVGIGQPPLSQQIKDLERELGAQLFRRVPHGAELTEAGKAFYDVVKGMPATATRAALAAQRVARGESGVLRVGFTASAAFNSVVPGAIRTFKRAYPDVRLQLEEGNTTQLADELNEGSLDVAFLRPVLQAMNGSSSGYCLKSRWLLCWQKRILLRRVNRLHSRFSKMSFFYSSHVKSACRFMTQ